MRTQRRRRAIVAALRGLGAVWRTAWAEALANRRSFVVQMTVMMVNDLVWIFFWQVFFRRVGSVRGWTVDDMMVLYAILALAAGLVLGALANLRWLGPLVANGDLDSALALPVDPLGFLALRQVSPVNVGDLVFGIGLFLWLGHPTPARLALLAVATAASVAVLAGFLALLGSLAFLPGTAGAGELGLSAVIVFSSYPTDLFGGALRLALFAVVPAALVGSLPAELVQHPSPAGLAGLAGGAAAFAGAGWLSFRLGLRRYTSGAAWTAL
ncbi:MAG: ABC-2 family transporter protein [Acidimicrobiales bacterium]